MKIRKLKSVPQCLLLIFLIISILYTLKSFYSFIDTKLLQLKMDNSGNSLFDTHIFVHEKVSGSQWKEQLLKKLNASYTNENTTRNAFFSKYLSADFHIDKLQIVPVNNGDIGKSQRKITTAGSSNNTHVSNGLEEIELNINDLEEIDYWRKSAKRRHRWSQNEANYPPIKPNARFPPDVKIIRQNIGLCANAPYLRYIIYIHSAPHNFVRRKSLRSSWVNRNLLINSTTAVIFVMGKANDTSTDESIRLEMEQHGDILQADFVDNDKNQTLKGLLALRWVTLHCSLAAFVIKANDDTLVNIFKMADILETYKTRSKLLVCDLVPTSVLQMNARYIPEHVEYKRYCSGLAFAMSMALAEELYRRSKDTPYFGIENIYLTGILYNKVELPYYDVNLFHNSTTDQYFALMQYKSLFQNDLYVLMQATDLLLPIWQYMMARLPDKHMAMLSSETRKQHQTRMVDVIEKKTRVKCLECDKYYDKI